MHVRVVTVRVRRLGAALLFPALLLAGACSEHTSATAGTSDAAPDSPAWQATLRLVRDDFPGVPHMTTAQLAERLEEDPTSVLLLDARSLEEYEVSHLRGAVNAETTRAALEVLAEVAPEPTVVVYCSVGYRSSELADRLLEHGRGSVFNLEGSIFRWANEGRPVYRGDERVYEVHPYDDGWGRLLEPQSIDP